MKFKDDLYRVLSTDVQTDVMICEVVFRPQHPLYKAHFPGNPITPGVVLLQMATEQLELFTGKRLSLNTVTNIKFKKPIGPSSVAKFLFGKLKTEGQMVGVNISVEVEDAQYVKLSLVYDLKEPL